VKILDNKLIRVIAVFKLLKAAVFIVLALGALKLVHTDVASFLEEWVLKVGLNPGGRYIGRALLEAANLTPNRIKDIAVGSLIYAALFLTEGIGLWMVKRWAEWMTIILTSSLVPLEVYEIFRHPNVTKVIVLSINLALVAYLIYRVRMERAEIKAG
jgi:uncharacterized membrane protein (DUF2068 family)